MTASSGFNGLATLVAGAGWAWRLPRPARRAARMWC